MVRITCLMLILGVGLVTTLGPDARGDDLPTKSPSASVAELIAQLGSPDFHTRERATRQLLERRDALPALEDALRSGDAEVRTRAERVRNGWRERLAKEALRRAVGQGKAGEVDLFVDTLVSNRDAADDECWRAAVELAHSAVARASRATGKKFQVPGQALLGFPVITAGDLKVEGFGLDPAGKPILPAKRRVAAESLDSVDSLVDGLLVSRGPVRMEGMVNRSVVLGNGNVTVEAQAFDSIIFCDGDVSILQAKDSVICCTGDAEVKSHVTNCVIVAAGSVKVGTLLGSNIEDCLIKEKQSDLLGLRPFQTSRQGIEVTASDGEVRVRKVDADKPFGKAGVLVGDRVAALDGDKIDNPETFRKLLRRKAAEKPSTTLKLTRDGKPVEIRVWLPE